METEQDQDLRKVICAFPNHRRHFLLEPVLLQCGHSMCKSCIFHKHFDMIKCNTCGIINAFDQENAQGVDNMLNEAEINQAFFMLKETFNSTVNDLKNSISRNKKKLEVDVKYAKEEIEIRVESLKIELDVLRESLSDKIDEYTKQFNSKVEMIEKASYDEYMLNLNDINSVNHDQFDTHASVLKSLQDEIELFNASYNLEFQLSEANIPSELIADINFKTNLHHDKINKSMLNDSKLIEAGYFDHGCVLPNGNMAFHFNHKIHIYNRYYQLLRKIDKLNEKEIKHIRIMVTYNNTYIYIFHDNYEKHIPGIIMTDIDFKFIKEYKLPLSYDVYKVHYKDLRLYKEHFCILCEFDTGYGIFKLQRDFDSLTMNPIQNDVSEMYYMEICNDLMMIGGMESSVVFFTLNDFQKKFSYSFSKFVYNSFVFNGYFYEVDLSSYTAYCYDKNGVFVDKIVFPISDNIQQLNAGSDKACFLNGREKTLTFTIDNKMNLIYKLK